MTREHYVVGQPPDWSRRAQQFSPLTDGGHLETHCTPSGVTRSRYFSPLIHPARRAPMATRRYLRGHQVEALRRRWFAIGSLATATPLLIALAVVDGLGLL